MTFVFRKNIIVPDNIILGTESIANIIFEDDGIVFYINGEAQVTIDENGLSGMAEVLEVSQSITSPYLLLYAVPDINEIPQPPAAIFETSNEFDFIGLYGVCIDVYYDDAQHDYRLYLPRVPTEDNVIFCNDGFSNTAVLKFLKNFNDIDGNTFVHFDLGDDISGDSYTLGGIINLNGTVAIYQPWDADHIDDTANMAIDTATALGYVNAINAYDMLWHHEDSESNLLREVEHVHGFYAPDFVGVYEKAIVTLGPDMENQVICMEKLIPIMWAAIQELDATKVDV